ncbi:MAG: feruloyl-CoA synthase, partial [Hylemonella sp.]|nr:feruloyl-CoA synthase [Hylemonella sp.]
MPITPPRYRPLTFGVTRVTRREGADGVQYLQAEEALADYPARITDRLVHWAQTAPQRSFMARRQRLADGSSGDWQHISYAQALQAARSIGQALVDRRLSAERPVAILSE